jgi:hypothetical protein
MAEAFFLKDPDAVELYGVDFEAVLAANELVVDQVSGHQVLSSAGIVLHTSSRSGARVTARIGGGTAGTVYTVRFRLLVAIPGVAGPQPFDKTIQIRCEDQ